MTVLMRKALGLCCVLFLVVGLMPTVAWAEEGKVPAELVSLKIDRTDAYDIEDRVVHSVSNASQLIMPLALDGDVLDSKTQQLYDDLCEGLSGGKVSVTVHNDNYNNQQVKDAVDLVFHNPELWWIGLSCEATGSFSIQFVFAPVYPEEKVPQLQTEVENSIAEALSWIDEDADDFQKVQVLHDYLVRTCHYSPTVAAGGASQLKFHRAASALSEDKETVCQGYALAYKLLLKRAGVDAVYVASEKMAHGWNMVKLGETWYHVDVTWDDPVYIDGSGKVSDGGFDAGVSHKYFLKGDNSFRTMDDPHTDWSTSLTASSDYNLPSSFPEYKAPYVRDCTVKGHLDSSLTSKENVVAATCTTPGSFTVVSICPSCKEEKSHETNTVPALGHQNTTKRTEGIKAATCTAAGSYAEVTRCGVCGQDVARVAKTLPALGHVYGAYVSNGDARIGVDGTKTAVCSRCGSKDTRTDAGTALAQPKPPAPKAPSLKKLTGLKAKSSLKKTATVSWKVGATITFQKKKYTPVKYQLRYTTDKKLKKSLKTVSLSSKQAKKLTKKNVVTYTVKKLKSKKTYYVQVRAQYKVSTGTYWSPWTAAKKVKVK